MIETWAGPPGANCWELNADRALSAIERGNDISKFHRFLEDRDDQELPETVQAFLGDCGRKGKALEVGAEATLIHCRDAESANLVCAQEELKDRCHRCHETLLAVESAHLPKFRKTVRSLGFGVVFPAHDGKSD